MQQEIKAAEKSLAETEQRLSLDANMLRMALELAGDVAQVYARSNEQTKRGYNQAFFTGLYITPEWDEAHGQTAIRVTRAELTEPYAALLADNLVPEATKAARLIRKSTTKAGSDPVEPLPAAAISIYLKLAEREGFEPSNEVNPRYAISSRAHSTALAPLHRSACCGVPERLRHAGVRR
jgi:hypothetical protein